MLVVSSRPILHWFLTHVYPDRDRWPTILQDTFLFIYEMPRLPVTDVLERDAPLGLLLGHENDRC